MLAVIFLLMEPCSSSSSLVRTSIFSLCCLSGGPSVKSLGPLFLGYFWPSQSIFPPNHMSHLSFSVRFSCNPDLVGTVVNGAIYQCDNSNNNGWRCESWRVVIYSSLTLRIDSYYTMGALMVVLGVLRIFLFPMDESPKFLVSEYRFSWLAAHPSFLTAFCRHWA